MKKLSLIIIILFSSVVFAQTQGNIIQVTLQIDSLSTAIRADSLNANLYWFRSIAYTKKYKNSPELEIGVAKAIADLDKMLSLNAVSSKIYENKGFLYQSLADDQSTRYLYSKPNKNEGWEEDETKSNEKEKLILLKDSYKNYKLSQQNFEASLQLNHSNEKVETALKFVKKHIEIMDSNPYAYDIINN